jgi:ABC-type lipoprotein export system ATPase subunit
MTVAGPVISGRGVSRHYVRSAETVTALRDIDVELHPGEVVALVGPSGSGKTTLLNLLYGWEHADTGVVQWRDGSTRLEDRPWRDVAIVPQALGLLEDLTIGENITLPARLAGEAIDAFDVGGLFDHLAISSYTARRPHDTSLGEQQRAAIARALLLGPSLLLADEPTAHQDATNAGRILDQLAAAADAGSCCLIATHSAEVQAAATRILRLVDGRFS